MSQPYYVLEIRYPDGMAETHEVHEERRILGRSKVKADMQIADKKVSGRHVEIQNDAGRIHVRDLGSTNGTFFHGSRVQGGFELHPGESFKMGDAVIRLMAVHGLEQDEDAKTVVGMPAWLAPEENEDSTRALNASELAGLLNQNPAASSGTPGWGQAPSAPQQPADWGQAQAPSAPQQPADWGQPQAPQQPADWGQSPAQQPGQAPAGWGQPQAQQPGQAPAGWGQPQAQQPGQAPAGWGQPQAQQPGQAPAGWGQPQAQPPGQPPADWGQPQAQQPGQAPADWGQPAAQQPGQPPADWGQPSGSPSLQKPSLQKPSGGAPARPSAGASGNVSASYSGEVIDMLKSLGMPAWLAFVPMIGFIFIPFLIVAIRRYVYEKLTIRGPRGQVRLSFNGDPIEMVKALGVHFVISAFIPLYYPWSITKGVAWMRDHTVGLGDDGTEYRLQFALDPIEFVKALGIHILFLFIPVIGPLWFLCRYEEVIAENTTILVNGSPVGRLSCHMDKDALLKPWVINFLLTAVTFGIWGLVLQQKVIAWTAEAQSADI